MTIPAELVDLLVQTETVTRAQWDRAAKAVPRPRGLEAVLDELARGPAWWGEGFADPPPGLTAYQRECVLRHAVAEDWRSLGEDLAVNGFVLLDQLGRGGVGRVMKAWQVKFRRLVAVKRMLHDTDLQRRRFENEARAMMRIHHPNIARFYQYEPVRDADGRATEAYLIAMEYVPGQTVRAAARRGLPWREAALCTAELLDALEVIHEKGFVHRDVKPENVVVVAPAGGPAVKLLDLGATRATAGADALARAGTIVGTPEYMAPEMWAGGDRVAAASDVYALGGTLYFMLTGQAPYRDEDEPRNLLDLKEAHRHSPPPDPGQRRADIPAPVRNLTQRMMSKAVGDRGAPAVLAAEFRALLAVEPARPRPRPAPPRPSASLRPEPRRDRDAPSAAGTLLNALEQVFLPADARPTGFEAEQMTGRERLRGLARRPLFVLAVVAAVAALGFCLWRI